MRADLGWSYLTAGMMDTVNAAGQIVGSALAGRIADGGLITTAQLARPRKARMRSSSSARPARKERSRGARPLA